MGHEPNKFQKVIYSDFRSTSNNMLVGAVAGSGKTTSLLELMKFARGEITFLAFNKSIVEELKERVPRNVNVMTMHSLGIKSIMRKHGKVNINANKTGKFIKQNLEDKVWGDELKKSEVGLIYLTVPRLVDIYRMTLCESQEDLLENSTRIGAEFNLPHIEYAMDVIGQMSRYNKNPKEIDFTDMIYLPATDSTYSLNRSDIWFVDECQDLSPCQHLLFKRARGRSRFVAVGDPHQAIYGFTGADPKSFSKFLNYPNTKQYPLSVCYRCPTKVVAHANAIYDIIESPEWMPVGEAYKGNFKDAEDGDMVICRNVKPLVSAFFKLIAQQKKAYIKGKDIGENLIKVVRPFKGQSIDSMFDGLLEIEAKLEEELMSQGITNPRKHPRYITLTEKHDIIKVISNNYETPRAILNALEEMFGDNAKEGVILSSIHKSKGLEADNVFFLDQHLIPSQYANTPEQIEQEMNLKYVAITRAKKKIIYCFS